MFYAFVIVIHLFISLIYIYFFWPTTKFTFVFSFRFMTKSGKMASINPEEGVGFGAKGQSSPTKSKTGGG